MCHATSAGRKAGSVSTNKSQFVDTLSMNKAHQLKTVPLMSNRPEIQIIFATNSINFYQAEWEGTKSSKCNTERYQLDLSFGSFREQQ